MFEVEQSQLEGKIRAFCAQNGLPELNPAMDLGSI